MVFVDIFKVAGGRKIIEKKNRWKIEKIRWKKVVLSHCKISCLSQMIIPSQFHSQRLTIPPSLKGTSGAPLLKSQFDMGVLQ